jgi:uncharacterized protein (DUF305 family)
MSHSGNSLLPGAAMKGTWQFAVLLVSIPAAALQAPGNQPTAERAWSELMKSMDQMHTRMATVERSGDSDIDFARLMLPHHQAAIGMARTELVYGKDPQMRRLAQEIVTDQQSERCSSG